jgi:hypothetical protein
VLCAGQHSRAFWRPAHETHVPGAGRGAQVCSCRRPPAGRRARRGRLALAPPPLAAGAAAAPSSHVCHARPRAPGAMDAASSCRGQVLRAPQNRGRGRVAGALVHRCIAVLKLAGGLSLLYRGARPAGPQTAAPATAIHLRYSSGDFCCLALLAHACPRPRAACRPGQGAAPWRVALFPRSTPAPLSARQPTNQPVPPTWRPNGHSHLIILGAGLCPAQGKTKG